MHYKNGREAKNGDRIVVLDAYGGPVVGILYNAVPGVDFCNGNVASPRPTDPVANLSQCLHVDDVIGAVTTFEIVPDRSRPVSVEND